MNPIDKIQDEIVDEFNFFDDWMQKYEYIIDLGKDLPQIEEAKKNDAHRIKGCQSQVWLDAQLKDNTVDFTADSDAVITKGIIALLIRVLSRQSPEDIAQSDLYFIDKIGLKEHLSPTRSNGLVSMVKKMKSYGVAFAHQNSSKA
jgi:cysteine desulfuration protein SufE